MAAVLAPHRRVVLALSLLFPSVILLSAVASYLGAGAHLITAQILDAAGHRSFGVATWLILGLPLAVVSSHVCTELILRLFTRREDRREPVSISLKDMQAHSASPISGPLTTAQTRSAMLEVLGEDYIRTARAKGLPANIVLWRHALRNAMIPVLTILGLQFAFLLAGTIIIENVFYLPGLGRMIFQAITQRDLIVVQSVVVVLVFAVVLVSFLIDLAYLFADPRLRGRRA